MSVPGVKINGKPRSRSPPRPDQPAHPDRSCRARRGRPQGHPHPRSLPVPRHPPPLLRTHPARPPPAPPARTGPHRRRRPARLPPRDPPHPRQQGMAGCRTRTGTGESRSWNPMRALTGAVGVGAPWLRSSFGGSRVASRQYDRVVDTIDDRLEPAVVGSRRTGIVGVADASMYRRDSA